MAASDSCVEVLMNVQVNFNIKAVTVGDCGQKYTYSFSTCTDYVVFESLTLCQGPFLGTGGQQ